MPFVRGLRDYSYYYDEDEDFDDGYSFEERRAMRMSKVPPYKPVETLKPVIEALQSLPKGYSIMEETAFCNLEERGQGDADGKEPQQFYAEETFSLSDIKVTVERVGELSFPLQDETIQKLINVSTKAKFGSQTEELLDTRVRDTHMIPASELKVDINQDTLNEIITRMGVALNIDDKCVLKPHLYNMLIYSKKQFFDWHKDTEKIENMIATMVVALPSSHEGGDLYVKHGTQSHVFSSSESFQNNIKCITFYSDCEHCVYSVQNGHRIVLTYNIELQQPTSPEVVTLPPVDLNLSNAVNEHFAHSNNPARLTVFLLHRYSEQNMKWHMLKGRDRTYAQYLLSVAKEHELTASLALANCLEVWEASDFHGPVRNDAFVKLYYWIDDSGTKLNKCTVLNYDAMMKEVCMFHENFWRLGEPDKEEKLGWYGNSPAIREQWYHKACVVLSKK